jgi:hypothetical protein
MVAVVGSAVAIVAMAVVGVGVASTGLAPAAVVLPLLEASNTCAEMPSPPENTMTVWGSHLIPNTAYTVEDNGALARTNVTTDASGTFALTLAYTAQNVDGNPDTISVLNQATGAVEANRTIALVGPGQCPTPAPAPPPVSCRPAGVPVPLTVSGTEIDSNTAIPWYIDYPGAGHSPTPFATSTVNPNAPGTTSATLPGPLATPGPHIITVIVTPPPGAVALPTVYWTFPIVICAPPPPTTTTTTRPKTATSAPPVTTGTTAPPTTVSPGTTTTTIPLTVPALPPVVVPPPPPATGGPALTIAPGVAVDGQVTEVRGAGFPPGSVVALQWISGLGQVTTTVAPDGTFIVAFLVLPHDETGFRAVHAVGYPPGVSAPLLVELGPSGPPAASGEWDFRQGS